LRTPAAIAVLLLLSASVLAQSVQLKGSLGFLSEYEISASVSAPSGGKRYFGRMLIKHVGMCTHDGPEEKEGDLSLQMLSPSRVKATLSFEGQECTFSGRLSDSNIGSLDCPNRPPLPLRLWVN
jgi:hypothetical protein